MIYKNIGHDKVSAIGFGTSFHLPENVSGKNIDQTLASCVDNGINLIDTAPVYGNGLSETLLGSAIKKIGRDKVFLASKVLPNDTTYNGVIKSAEESLKRLQTDRLDLHQIHWPNPNVPIHETMLAMEKLVADGKIRHIGVSNFLLDEVKDIQLTDNALATLQLYSWPVSIEMANNRSKYYCDSKYIKTITSSRECNCCRNTTNAE